MSTPDVSPPSKHLRNPRRKRTVLNIDLNVPPCEESFQQGNLGHAGRHAQQTTQRGSSMPSTVIDVESFDDDIVISSPGAFAEAKNRARRAKRSVVIDVESEQSLRSSANYCKQRRRLCPSATYVYLNVEKAGTQKQQPPKAPAFSCPICMGPFVEETSTKCGHIFCKGCIKKALAVQPNCPTCRSKVSEKQLFRIYLPTAN